MQEPFSSASLQSMPASSGNDGVVCMMCFDSVWFV